MTGMCEAFMGGAERDDTNHSARYLVLTRKDTYVGLPHMQLACRVAEMVPAFLGSWMVLPTNQTKLLDFEEFKTTFFLKA